MSVQEAAYRCILIQDIEEKISETNRWTSEFGAEPLRQCEDDYPVLQISSPGRPQRLKLVHPTKVPRRGWGSKEGHAAFIHALAHIEFNAINLAWDAVYRFRGHPDPFYLDWMRVAREECYHFSLLNTYLGSLGHRYGDFEAHDGLWDMAQQTVDSVLNRMALVPRVLEARGLDVTPGMIKRLKTNGYTRAAEILEIIYQDEIGHVEIGTRWYRYHCELQGLDAVRTFKDLISAFALEKIRPPLNRPARNQAGFLEAELDYLSGLLESESK
ncbi:MAG: ferritin-like domain-containing protein [Gammaproteobacteria bacterium]|nr:ferritin-like domain-containing protein [Gammaproteobacteria bacterium]